MDSSFTLVEDKRGSGRAKLSCIGRDIEYREIELERNEDNVWQLISDTKVMPGGNIPAAISAFMSNRTEYIGTPTEFADEIDPDGTLGITPKKAARLISESLAVLRQTGITVVLRRSNGKRIIELHRAESVDTPRVDPIDPCEATGADFSAVSATDE